MAAAITTASTPPLLFRLHPLLSLRCLSVVGGSVTGLSFCPWCPLGSWGHVETPPPLRSQGLRLVPGSKLNKVCCPDGDSLLTGRGSSFLPGLRSGASHCTFLWALGSDRAGEASLHCLPCARCGVICVASIHPCGLSLCCPVLLRRARTPDLDEAVLLGSGSLWVRMRQVGPGAQRCLHTWHLLDKLWLLSETQPTCQMLPGKTRLCLERPVKCDELGLRALDETNPGLCALFLVCCFYAAGQLLTYRQLSLENNWILSRALRCPGDV